MSFTLEKFNTLSNYDTSSIEAGAEKKANRKLISRKKSYLSESMLDENKKAKKEVRFELECDSSDEQN